MIHENIKSDDNRLKSSQLYDLKGLFVSSDNSKIVIPDLQRDYCWGTTGNLVVDFVDNLRPQGNLSHSSGIMGFGGI